MRFRCKIVKSYPDAPYNIFYAYGVIRLRRRAGLDAYSARKMYTLRDNPILLGRVEHNAGIIRTIPAAKIYCINFS